MSLLFDVAGKIGLQLMSEEERAKQILSLPTELVKVEKCKNCNGTGAFFWCNKS